MGNKWSRHANRGGPVHFTPRWMRAAAATDTSLPVNLAHQLSPATTTPAEPTMAAKAFRGGGGTTASRSVRPSIRRWGSRRDARNLALAPNLPPPHPPGKQEPEERDSDQSMDDTWLLLLLLLRQYQPVTFSH